MNYTSANEKLQGRNRDRRKLANNTYLERRGDNIAIRLHDTDILTFTPDGSTIVNTVGPDGRIWHTVTTKQRLNEYLEGYSILQERGIWYVAKGYRDRVAVYRDGMKILADGTLEGVEPLTKAKADLKLRQRVQRYAKGYIAAMRQGKVEAPGLGDCLYCQFRETPGNGTSYGKLQADGTLTNTATVSSNGTGRTMGEIAGDGSHLLSHLSEKYYVPSLLVRSLEVMPSSIAMKDTVARCWQNKDCTGWGDWVWQQIQKNLSRYILRQLGQAA